MIAQTPPSGKSIEDISKELVAKWQAEIENEPVHDTKAFIAAAVKQGGIKNPYVIQELVKSLSELAERQGIATNRKALIALIEDELRARAEVRDAAAAKGISKVSPKETPKEALLKTIDPDSEPMLKGLKPPQERDPNNIDDHFPSDDEEDKSINPETGEITSDEDEDEVKRWQDHSGTLSQFWAKAGEIGKQYALKSGQINEAMHRALGVASVKDWTGTGSEAIQRFKDHLGRLAAQKEQQEIAAPPSSPVHEHMTPKERIRTTHTLRMGRYDKKANRQVLVEYLTVAGRIALFRIDFPIATGWGLLTEVMERTDQGCLYVGKVVNPMGIVVATGFARAIYEGSDRYSGRVDEKAETAAMGRALAKAGYGTEDIDESDESDGAPHLADAPTGAA